MSPRRATLLCLLLLAVGTCPAPAEAQTTIHGSIRDGAGAPVPYANVQLLAGADSSLAQGAVADDGGRFVLPAVRSGAYLLYVSLIGYRDHLSAPFTLSGEAEYRLPPVTLAEEAIEMEELSVEARRTLYEQRGDRLVINVGTSLTLSGATALDVLERAPGVVVNRQASTLSMLGKDGVRVLINGKTSYIPAEGLLDYLAGMSADNVETIELITAPPAELDAEGNAGYVNIVLKRSPEDGTNGSVAISAGYGRGEVGSMSGNVNLVRDRLSLFGSYSFVWTGQLQYASNFRRVAGPEGISERPTVSRRDPTRGVHNAQLGLDYQLTGRTTVGLLVGAYDNRWSMTARNELTTTLNGAPVTRIVSDNDEINHWRHAMANVNLRHRYGDGRSVSVDFDYLYYYNDNPTDYLNSYTDVSSGQILEERLESGKITPLGIAAVRVDYALEAGERWDVAAGAKTALSRFTNEADFGGLVEDEWVSEIGVASRSHLREDVYALYGKADYKASPSALLKVGLRYELTVSNLGSDEEADLVDRRFGSLFPSAAISYRLTEAHQVDASYTRRITRPSFNDMAPFLYFIDPSTFFTGNVALQPAVINTFKLDYTFKSVLASLQYAWEDSAIARFQNRVLVDDDVQLIFATNLTRARVTTAMLALPVQIARWWSTQLNVMLLRQDTEGIANDQHYALARSSVRLNATQNVTLPRDLGLEATGYYQSGGIAGAMRVEPSWGMNLGLQWALPNDRGKLTFAVNDVFDSARIGATAGSPGDPIYLERQLNFWHRTFNLTFSTRFGDGKATKRRSTASQEERERVQ